MATKIFVPKMGANIESAQIGKIMAREGDQVKKGDILMEMITDKATFDIEADATGTILKLFCKEKDEVRVLDIVGWIGEKGEIVPEQSKKEAVKATPGARKLAREQGIDIDSTFAGSQKIIREEDLKVENTILIEQGFRKKAEVAHLSRTRENIYSAVTVECSIANLKEELAKHEEQQKQRISRGQYICYRAAKEIINWQLLNAHYNPKGAMAYKECNLGIAMSPQDELIVPIIKNADKKSLAEFAEAYTEAVMRIIRSSTTPEELMGGTFTVTDLSAFNALDFIPVINEGQSAILGVSAEHDSVKLAEGKLAYDPKINLTVAFDHRVTDGKYALGFLNRLKKSIEEPTFQ